MLINQAGAFTSTIVAGISAGLLYDYYRAVRAVYQLRRIGTFVGDVIYWLVTTVMVFLMLLRGTSGELRLYVLIGLCLGAFLYFQLFSRAVYRVFRLKFQFINRTWAIFLWTVHWLWFVVTYPVRLSLFILSYPYLLLKRVTNRMLRGFKSFWYQLIGRRFQRIMAGFKRRAARLVFWKRKKDD